jgi:outer membrane lipoprotein-sorting protein
MQIYNSNPRRFKMFSKKLLVFVMATILCISMWQVLSAQTLQEILDKHAEALGGKEALKALGNSVTVFNITVPGGMTGTQKSYFKYPNKIKDEVDLGIFTSLTVFDGQKGWTKDPNGQVRELAGQELEGIRTNLYFSCYAYLFQERGKGEVEYLGREEAGGINYHIIQVTPEDCEPVKLYINPETFLVDRTVSKQDVVVNTSFLSDYQVFEGIKIATSSRLNRGDTTYDIRSKLVSVEFNPPLSDELFSIPQAAGKDYKFPG